MLGLLNQDPPLVDHVVTRRPSRAFDNTDMAWETRSCPVIPAFGNDPMAEELPKSWRPLSRLKLVPTRMSEEVPVLFREIYICRGFRAPYQCWRYYLLSFFQLHNESMNVWTHFIATFLMARKIFLFSYDIDFWNDSYSWQLLAGGATAMLMYVTSTLAHWFQAHSELVYYFSFMMDYASIGLYSFSSVTLHYTYSADNQVYEWMRHIYLPLGATLGFLICFCNVTALVMLRRDYPRARKLSQTVPIAVIYVLLISPIVHRIYLCVAMEVDCARSIELHVKQIAWFLLSAVFFVSHLPQRALPGRFDHFFHSHQLFHVCIAASTLFQMDAAFEDFFHCEDMFRVRAYPTAREFLLPFGLIVLGEVVTISSFLCLVRSKLVVPGGVKLNETDSNNNRCDGKFHKQCDD